MESVVCKALWGKIKVDQKPLASHDMYREVCLVLSNKKNVVIIMIFFLFCFFGGNMETVVTTAVTAVFASYGIELSLPLNTLYLKWAWYVLVQVLFEGHLWWLACPTGNC